MKTIAVDESTWNKLRVLREKLQVRSYDELIQLLIDNWKNSALDKVLEDLEVPDEIVHQMEKIVKTKEEKG